MNNKIKENEIIYFNDLDFNFDINSNFYLYEMELLKEKIDGYKLIKCPEKIIEDNYTYQFIYGKETTAVIEYIDMKNEEKISEDYTFDTYFKECINADIKVIDGYIYDHGGQQEIIDTENKHIKIFYKKEDKKINSSSKKRIINKHDNVQEKYGEIRVIYKDFNTNKILLEDKVTYKEGTKFIKYKTKRIEGYKIMDDEEKSIINEIINDLNVEELNVEQKKKSKEIKDEYEIVMNCDKSDYIIYYKK